MSMFKNGVGRPSNEIIRKRNIFKGVCVLLILIIIGLVVYILNDKGIFTINNNTGDNTVTTTKSTVEELDINDREVLDLFNKYNVFDLNMDAVKNIKSDENSEYLYTYFYINNEKKNDEVEDEVKLAYSLYNLIGKNDKLQEKVYLKDINKVSKEMFGTEVDVEKIGYDNKNILNVGVCRSNYCALVYNKKDQSFTSEGGIGDGEFSKVTTKITGAKRIGNKLEITNKVLYYYSSPGEYWDDSSDDVFKVFKTATNKFDNGYYGLTNEIDDISKKDVDDVEFDKYSNKLDSYKWTFVKQGNNYIFDSVEKVK